MKFFSKKEKPMNKRSVRAFSQAIGSLGYDYETDGRPSLEFMSELAPPHGLEKFRKMKLNDPIVGGLVLQIENIMRRLTPIIEGENAPFITETLNSLPGGMPNLNYAIASAFTYGFYIGEKVYAYNKETGRTDLVDIEPRFAPSIVAIKDRNGKVRQECSEGTFLMPYEKCVHHTFFSETRNPFGISILRHLYKPYYYKISIEASEAVGIDRDLTGMPVLHAPEGFNFEQTDADSPDYDAAMASTLDWAINIVSSIRKDSMSGVVMPFGWVLDIVRGTTSGTAVPTSDIISRYNTEMAAGMLENFMALGAFATTNNANTDVNVDTFLDSCDTYAAALARTYQEQIINPLCLLNKLEPPVFKFNAVLVEDLSDIASFFTRLVNAGVITPSTTLEKELMVAADFTYDPTAKPVPTTDEK